MTKYNKKNYEHSRKIVIFEIIIITLIFILVPVFYNNINAYLLTENSQVVNKKFEDSKIIIENGFTITAYCKDSCCNGIWAGMTATGKSMEYYLKRKINIIAVDPELIPIGTKIIYNNTEYMAVDVGGLIKGKRLDILVPTHDDTIKFGIKRDQEIRILH